jgi:hypothetical protein
MAIDPTGTRPGLQENAPKPPEEIHIRCKSGNCDSILAIELKIAGIIGPRRMYQCVKCKRTWGVPVGGSVEFG